MTGNFVWSCDPVMVNIFGFGVKYYVVCMCIAASIILIVFSNYFFDRGVSDNAMFMYSAICVMGSTFSARLFEGLFYNYAFFSHDPIGFFLPIKITSHGIQHTPFAGISSHGGFLFLLMALYLVCRREKIKYLEFLDDNIWAAYIAGGFIRIGNFFNSEIFGIETTSSLGIIFSRIDNVPRYPVQLFEATEYFLFGIFHFYIIKKLQIKRYSWYKDGYMSCLSVFCILFVRSFLENIKYTTKAQLKYNISLFGVDIYQLNTGQILNLAVLTCIFIVFVIIAMQKNDKTNKI